MGSSTAVNWFLGSMWVLSAIAGIVIAVVKETSPPPGPPPRRRQG